MSDERPVLGIDPGLNRTGYAVVVRNGRAARLIEGGVVRTDRERSLSDRLCDIAQGLREVIAEHQPRLVAVEQAFAQGRNLRSSMMIAHVRGAILLVAAENQLPVIHMSATEVKRLLTGFGRASKEQIQAAIRAEFQLTQVLEPNDVADASAVALSVLYRVKFAA
ncbi:MAG: crossover junction endodeoxyribonuclease RuvC [Planctomycetota bacterium]|nr:crossover junction endodeoxyribonuclease RuvC [Planctomycetaceae bacterium]MDQ3332348.1 crossover junction endodeoxyribonuclease RuvC [Planctomycetota bacterium]